MTFTSFLESDKPKGLDRHFTEFIIFHFRCSEFVIWQATLDLSIVLGMAMCNYFGTDNDLDKSLASSYSRLGVDIVEVA